MPPKKGGKKKSNKPEWMSPELYDLSMNLPKLQVSCQGDAGFLKDFFTLYISLPATVMVEALRHCLRSLHLHFSM